MQKAVFRNYITGSNSSGAQSYTSGDYVVYCDIIPPDCKTDWSMGPKMVPGEYGIFLQHLFYPRRHGHYAVATGKTEDDAMSKASGLFQSAKDSGGKVSDWEEVNL